MSQITGMRDVRGYRAYQRLKRGWRLISLALLGLGLSPMIEGFAPAGTLSQVTTTSSLALGFFGSALTASGPLSGLFRWICLFLVSNFALLAVGGLHSAAWGWLTLLLALFAGDRCLRREMGLAKGVTWVPPGCLLGLLLVPFFWPVVMAMGGVFLFIYLLFAYTYVAGALPCPEDLAEQLHESDDQAMSALTRI